MENTKEKVILKYEMRSNRFDRGQRRNRYYRVGSRVDVRKFFRSFFMF